MLLLAGYVLSLPIANAQTTIDKLTVEEKQSITEIGNRFIQRLNESGDVEPLLKEMFVSDFMNRYVKEELDQIKTGDQSGQRILFTSGIEYNSDLLKKATEEDWRALYVNTFNFMQYGFAVMFNAQAKSIATGKRSSDGEFEKLLSEMYPASVMKMLNGNLILRNFVAKENDSRPIKNVEELREVNKMLAGANHLLIGTSKGKLTSESLKVLKLLTAKAGDAISPNLEVCDRECFGFPRGTRNIHAFVTPMHSLLIVKEGADYKILSARHGSPD